MIKINGNLLEYAPGWTVEELLTSRGYDPKRVAVELNGEILPKRVYPETLVQENDCLEVVRFVGGG